MVDHIRPAADIARDKFQAAVEQMARMAPHMAEYAKLNAEMKRAQYLAYIEAGFEPAQAIELCKAGP